MVFNCSFYIIEFVRVGNIVLFPFVICLLLLCVSIVRFIFDVTIPGLDSYSVFG